MNCNNQYYEKALSTSTERVYGNGELLASIDSGPGGTALYYLHPDNLGSTNVMSDSLANQAAVYDYAPFGTMRINNTPTPYDEMHRYVGSYYDIDDQLNYMQARYEDRARGRFISEDPMFRNPGTQNLQDPQSLNSYSYAENNPIALKDPSGKCPVCIIGLGLSAGYLYGLAYQHEYDVGRGQTSSLATYTDSGAKGIAQGGASAATLAVLGPTAVLEYYGYYQTYKNVQGFNEQVLSDNSINYNETQQRMTAGGVLLDTIQRIASRFTPQPAKAGYDATMSILNSLVQMTKVQNNSANPSSTQSSGSGLPLVVSQNGVTYTRNSSGLLNLGH